MAIYDLIATSTFGVEAIVAEELRLLGYGDLKVENGRVCFKGDERDIARCNITLRTADRVLIKMLEFKALDFEELFQQTKSFDWGELIPPDGKMHVVGKSHKSRLFSVPDCQSTVKKAVVEAMKRKYPSRVFDETGAVYKIEVALLNDIAALTIDTSGPGLHKRGYRKDWGETPLRETLAAALIKLSRWEPGRELADPFCGSGTIAIEAGLIGKDIAPGLNRSFVSESWPHLPQSIWTDAREEARSRIRVIDFRILASDADGKALKAARDNAGRAGLTEVISFQRQGVAEFRSARKSGCIVCNPPYGERVGKIEDVEAAYTGLRHAYRSLDGWSLFALSAHPEFERLFGRRADKKRKLFNGNLLCYLYQYLGPLPHKLGRIGID
jgi:putative N6-adenine-specific DNA methylase